MKRMLRGGAAIVAFGALLYAAGVPAQAAIVTSLTNGSSVTMPPANEFTSGPRTFGPITYTADYNYSVYGYTSGYGFSSNGGWSGTPMIGLNEGFGAMRLTFQAPVAGVLAEFNWTPMGTNAAPVVASSYDVNGAYIESIIFSLDSDNVRQPGYWGFQYSSNIIGSIALSNGYIGARNFSISNANAQGPVPEPATWALMVGGFGLIGAAMRRRRSVAVSFA